jgi:hypothetical protein
MYAKRCSDHPVNGILLQSNGLLFPFPLKRHQVQSSPEGSLYQYLLSNEFLTATGLYFVLSFLNDDTYPVSLENSAEKIQTRQKDSGRKSLDTSLPVRLSHILSPTTVKVGRILILSNK